MDDGSPGEEGSLCGLKQFWDTFEAQKYEVHHTGQVSMMLISLFSFSFNSVFIQATFKAHAPYIGNSKWSIHWRRQRGREMAEAAAQCDVRVFDKFIPKLGVC